MLWHIWIFILSRSIVCWLKGPCRLSLSTVPLQSLSSISVQNNLPATASQPSSLDCQNTEMKCKNTCNSNTWCGQFFSGIFSPSHFYFPVFSSCWCLLQWPVESLAACSWPINITKCGHSLTSVTTRKAVIYEAVMKCTSGIRLCLVQILRIILNCAFSQHVDNEMVTLVSLFCMSCGVSVCM